MNGRVLVTWLMTTKYARLGRNICPGNGAGNRPFGQRSRATFLVRNAVFSVLSTYHSPATTGTGRAASASQAEGRGFETRRPL